MLKVRKASSSWSARDGRMVGNQLSSPSPNAVVKLANGFDFVTTPRLAGSDERMTGHRFFAEPGENQPTLLTTIADTLLSRHDCKQKSRMRLNISAGILFYRSMDHGLCSQEEDDGQLEDPVQSLIPPEHPALCDCVNAAIPARKFVESDSFSSRFQDGGENASDSISLIGRRLTTSSILAQAKPYKTKRLARGYIRGFYKNAPMTILCGLQ